MWKKAIFCLFMGLFLLGISIHSAMAQAKPKVVSITCLGMGTIANVLASGLGEGSWPGAAFR